MGWWSAGLCALDVCFCRDEHMYKKCMTHMAVLVHSIPYYAGGMGTHHTPHTPHPYIYRYIPHSFTICKPVTTTQSKFKPAKLTCKHRSVLLSLFYQLLSHAAQRGIAPTANRILGYVCAGVLFMCVCVGGGSFWFLCVYVLV